MTEDEIWYAKKCKDALNNYIREEANLTEQALQQFKDRLTFDREMTETNKYYTPSIEEFHPGFEYEHQGCGKPENNYFRKTNLNKAVLGYRVIEEDSENTMFALEKCIEHKQVRVKYLDKEDIQSLGWELREVDEDNLVYLWSPCKKHSIILNLDTRKCIITMFDENERIDCTAFSGTLQNISELKRVLKQVGIV